MISHSNPTPPGDLSFRRDSVYGRGFEQSFSGNLSFLRRKLSRDLSNIDIAVTGIPLDLATTGRPGARFGPRAVREASCEVISLDAYPQRFDAFQHIAVVDYGDCHISFDIPQYVPTEIENHIATIIADDVMPLSIGGDHFVTYPIIKALYKKYGKLRLVHFDAHPDTWEDSNPNQHPIPHDHIYMNHGSMFRRAVLEDMIDPEHSIQIGIRTHVDDTMGFLHISPDDITDKGISYTRDMITERVGDGLCYLTCDIDCLDPAFAPGTGTPVTGGLTSRELLSIMRGLKNLNFVGMDVVEVCPSYDHGDITALAAATIAHDFICLMAEKKL